MIDLLLNIKAPAPIARHGRLTAHAARPGFSAALTSPSKTVAASDLQLDSGRTDPLPLESNSSTDERRALFAPELNTLPAPPLAVVEMLPSTPVPEPDPRQLQNNETTANRMVPPSKTEPAYNPSPLAPDLPAPSIEFPWQIDAPPLEAHIEAPASAAEYQQPNPGTPALEVPTPPSEPLSIPMTPAEISQHRIEAVKQVEARPDIETPLPSRPGHRSTPTSDGWMDWRTLPWHLQANVGLSYRFGQAMPNSGGIAAQSVLTRMHDTASLRTQASAHLFVDTASWDQEQLNTLRQRPMHPERSTQALENNWNGTSKAQITGSGLAAWLLWPQRLLRWRPDATSEGVVAWLRDFSLDTAGLPPLVDSIIALAKEQGIPLQRIMLNGHAVWSSTASSA